MTSFFSRLFNSRNSGDMAIPAPGVSLEYGKLILLDAEDLAEQGIVAAYEKLLPELRKYADRPSRIEEAINTDLPSYTVHFNGKAYVIYSAGLEGTEAEGWARATYALFAIVNEQLEETDVRFYAINSGNDLGGMFLAPKQAHAAQAGLARKPDWPYIPDLNAPYYGQYQ
jgi:hypothetical protein